MKIVFNKNKERHLEELNETNAKLLEEYNKHQNGKSSQNVFTPPALTISMLSYIDTLNDKTILVIANIETYLFLRGLKAKNLLDTSYKSVHFLTDNKSLKGKENIIYCDFNNLDKLKLDMKFDVVIGNPPYEGKKETHQKFFNRAVDLLKDGGSVIFVQPATPYLNNKEGKSNQQLMRKNVLKYITNVKLINPNVFENAAIMSTLAITHLVKIYNNSNKLKSVEFESRKIYNDVDLKNINYNGMDLEIFIPLRDKIEAYIQKNGSCESIYYRNDNGTTDYICKFPRVRGHMNNVDFYTFIPNDSKYLSSSVNEQNDFGLKVNSDLEIENIYHYVKTFIVRFCLSITKCTIMNQSEFRMIPLVDFSKRWTDESLRKEFGITEYEYSKILELIPPYYDFE